MTLNERSHVAIFNTGGFMGMKFSSPTHGVMLHEAGNLAEQMKDMEEFRDPLMPTYRVIEYDPLLASADMEDKDWIHLATDIERLYHEVDGFVIIMGTDTITYGASVLSFMLQNLGKPVIFTAGAVPLSAVFNDSRRNLVVSMLFACNTHLCEVCIFFNDALLRGNRALRIATASLNAFSSPNFPPLATLSTLHLKTPNLRIDLLLNPPKGRLIVHKKLEKRFLVVKLSPGFDDTPLHRLVRSENFNVRAFILETYGTGNAPVRKSGLLTFIKAAIERGALVVITSQVVRGKVNLASYEVGRKLLDLGVLSGEDMTKTAILAKLAYLFGRGFSRDQVRAAMETNLRGEMTLKNEPKGQKALSKL